MAKQAGDEQAHVLRGAQTHRHHLQPSIITITIIIGARVCS